MDFGIVGKELQKLRSLSINSLNSLCQRILQVKLNSMVPRKVNSQVADGRSRKSQ